MKIFNILKANFQKIIVLAFVLASSAALCCIAVFAWNEPGDSPPDILPTDNIYELINISGDSQTKAGDLTVSELTTSDGHLYLNADGSGGDVERVNRIKGHNDLHLWSDIGIPTAASIYLDKNEEEIEFYTNGTERMKIDKQGGLHIPGFQDCFLMANNDGKVMCYSGGTMPIGQEFQSELERVLHIGKKGSDSWTITNEEAVIKVTANMSAYCQAAMHFKFYINGVEKEHLDLKGGAEWDPPWGWDCWWRSDSETWYYHVKQGDVVEIATYWSYLEDWASGSASVYNLTSQRDVVEYVSCDDIILYYYDKDSSGEMGKVAQRFRPTVPVSMAVTADGIPIRIVAQ